MIVVHMAEQNRRNNRSVAVGTRAPQQLATQVDDAGSGVQDDRMSTRLHFDAGSIATEPHRPWPRHWIAAAYSPKANDHLVRHLNAPPHGPAAPRACVANMC
jgi:hypothetical protein